MQVIYNALGKIKDVYHLEYYKVRVTKDIGVFYVKNDWCDIKEKARSYPARSMVSMTLKAQPR